MEVEFNTSRSKSYKDAISSFPNVWNEDLLIMHHYLAPKANTTIVELGAGSGFFSTVISKEIGSNGKLIVVDPSLEQMLPLINNPHFNNIEFYCETAENFVVPQNDKIDQVWSRGAFHHVKNKEKVLRELARSAVPGAKCCILDIFTHNSVAKFFDSYIAHACTTGHEVSFLSRDYAQSLCKNTGWKFMELIDIELKWEFNSKEDIGVFLGTLLSLKPEYTHSDTLAVAEDILGISQRGELFYLNWPMTLLIAQKDY